MTFGEAIEFAKQGKHISREGWNGKNQFVFWGIPRVELNVFDGTAITAQDASIAYNCNYDSLGCMCMKTSQNKIQVGWLASQSDMLSEDWSAS